MNEQNTLIKLSVDRLERMAAPCPKGVKTAHPLAGQYGPILNKLNDVVFITDKAGHFIFVNKASEQRTGIPAKALVGLHYSEIVAPQYREIAQNHVQQVLRGENVAPALEMERRTPTGEKVTVEINWKVLTDENEAAYLMGTCRDISDRVLAQEVLKRSREELEMIVESRTAELKKSNELLTRQVNERIQAEEKLRESEKKYRGLFENSGDAVFIVDIETGTILDANRQAEKLTGHARQAIIGMHQSQLHPSQDFDYYTEKFRKHIANKHVFDLEADVVHKNGSVIPVFIYSNLIDLQGRKVIQGIFRDISKEKIISDLKGELRARKLVNRAKAIIAKRYSINDSEALKLLQRESRSQNRKIQDVAQAVISSKFILD